MIGHHKLTIVERHNKSLRSRAIIGPIKIGHFEGIFYGIDRDEADLNNSP